jgi:spermidine dehydrogenase
MAEQDGKRGITRRDFLDGTAITAAGLAAAAAAPHLTGAEAALVAKDGPLPKGYYPPTQTGLVGEPNRVIRQVMRVDGRPNPEHPHSAAGGAGIHPRRVRDTGETYDCVIVGAGISGLASAKWYRDRFGEDSRILLVDPLPDFGGHAHRNEFHIGGTTLLRYGGAINLDSIGTWNRPAGSPAVGRDIPGGYGQPALDMLGYLGVTPGAFPDTQGPGIPGDLGLRPMLLFPKADWGEDVLVPNRAAGQDWAAFFATTPYSPQAQAELTRLMTDTTTDYIAAKDGPKTDAEKKAILAAITYKRYLIDYAGLSEEATTWFQRTSHGLYGAGIQAVQAGDLWLLEYPGFEGLGLEPGDFPGVGRTAQMDAMADSDPTVAWPDGNASVARLLVSRLIPDAFEGPAPTQETIVTARCHYDRLDRAANDVRIRLNSFVFNVRPAGRGRALAAVDYVLGGQGRRVRARHVVMACWNRVTAHTVEGLPPTQVDDLTYARKVPLIYGRAGLRNWRAFANAKIASVSPRGNSLFWDSTSLTVGQKFGDVYGPTPNDPASPAILNFTCVPTDPSRLSQLSAYEAGRERLLHMSLADLEGALIDVLDRSVNRAGGDFEPGRDIESFMINRWNYGYAYELASPFDPSLYGPNADQPHVRGRVPFRNVAIANSDSGAFAYTHSAIDEGHRAVQDLPG